MLFLAVEVMLPSAHIPLQHRDCILTCDLGGSDITTKAGRYGVYICVRHTLGSWFRTLLLALLPATFPCSYW